MKSIFTLLACILWAGLACAQEINYRDFEEAGFGDVAELLKSMTPEQRAAIVKQATINEKQLQKMTPAQREQLLQQLHDVKATIAFDKIDPNKVDVSKVQGAAANQKNLDTYQEKYQQKKISNPVVVYPPKTPGSGGQ